jgi:hypothetical protein
MRVQRAVNVTTIWGLDSVLKANADQGHQVANIVETLGHFRVGPKVGIGKIGLQSRRPPRRAQLGG